MSKINKIQLSGTVYDIQDLDASKAVELTQAQYDALQTKDPDTFYIITDASPSDISGYWTSAETESAITEAISGKADSSAVTQALSSKTDTSVFNTYSAATDARFEEDEEVTAAALNALNEELSGKQDTLIAGDNITISGNVISADGGGGGKAVSGGTNISITTGETADTINCTLPISAGTGTNSIIAATQTNHPNKATANGAIALNGYGIQPTSATGVNSLAQGSSTLAQGNASVAEGILTKAIGNASHAEGSNTSAMTMYSHTEGAETKTTNKYEHASGLVNISVSASTTFGNSGNTLFSVGNGYNNSNRHNAFEIRQNGDIYIADTNDTSTSNYYAKPMVKLQDALGGGSITVDSALSSTSENPVQNKVIYQAIGDIETLLAAI